MKAKSIIPLLILSAIVTLGLFLLDRHFGLAHTDASVKADTITIVKHDTVTVYKPAPRDSTITGYVSDRLPKRNGNKGEENIPDFGNIEADNIPADSADVIIPIETKTYRDSTYSLQISGYRCNLDWIQTYNKRETVTIKEPPNPLKPKRWHLGVGVGYGITPHGAEPFVGVTLTYSILSF